MKKLLWVIILILLINLVSGAYSIFVRDSLKEGKAKAYKTDNGMYIIRLIIVSESKNAAKFTLNNEMSAALGEGKSYKFKDGSTIIVQEILTGGRDEVGYYFYGSGENPMSMDIEIEDLDLELCNFDGKCVNETKDECCYDCGCLGGYKCEENKCIRKSGCTTDDECDDDNPCTTDSCKNLNCKYEEKDGCVLGNKCVSYGAIKETDNINSYCSKNGWQPKKEGEKECANDYECLSGSCRDNKCYLRSFKGLFTIVALIIILSAILYLGKKYNLTKKIKKRLFWKF